jgi:hypothetical protein
MIGNLDEVLRTLLERALAGLLAGEGAPVTLNIVQGEVVVDPNSAEAEAGMPRPDQRTDQFAYDPETPPASFLLSQLPYPGPRRVRFTSDAGDRMPLSDDEVIWSSEDSQMFSLRPKAMRDMSDVTGVEVLYDVTAVFTKLKVIQSLAIQLQVSDEEGSSLAAAEALTIAVVELNRQFLIDNANALYEEGDHSVAIAIKSLKFRGGHTPAANQRQLDYQVEIELKASRALREDEGAPITSIRTTSRPFDPGRPVDIDIEIDA